MRLKVPNHCIRSGAIGVSIASLLLAACSSTSSPTPSVAPTDATATTPTLAAVSSLTADVSRNIIYAAVDELQTELDVNFPLEPGSWPVVIVVHGANQTGRSFENLSEAIALEGAVVYNIDANFTVPMITGIQRVACAVRFARATAADYGGDPSRITLVGNSAGANTGAVVALAGDDFGGDCVVPSGSALPDALVAFEGSYGYSESDNWPGFDHTYLKVEDPELWHAIDPYSHIGRNQDLQIRLIHGDDVDYKWFDVPLEGSIEFHQALVDAGYDVELVVLEGASHIALTSKHLFPDAFALTVQQVMEMARGSSQ